MSVAAVDTRSGIQRHRRVLHHLAVEVTADLVREHTVSHDLSASGMFVDTTLPYEVGQELTLSFCVGDQRIRSRAVVIHVQPLGGFGCQFLDLTPRARGILLRFVHTERASTEAERILSER